MTSPWPQGGPSSALWQMHVAAAFMGSSRRAWGKGVACQPATSKHSSSKHTYSPKDPNLERPLRGRGSRLDSVLRRCWETAGCLNWVVSLGKTNNDPWMVDRGVQPFCSNLTAGVPTPGCGRQAGRGAPQFLLLQEFPGASAFSVDQWEQEFQGQRSPTYRLPFPRCLSSFLGGLIDDRDFSGTAEAERGAIPRGPQN